jgi:UDP-N-acetylmuramate: L-alanyl-gamma-D-glutamyl-meso-diaminopimelate ligase
MHVHLIGICGTGMGSLAGLLKAAGHRVSGSDRAFYPPMGPALTRWGIETKTGYDPSNLEPAPDLVVVGNSCRKDHVEARAAIERGLRYASFPATLAELFLAHREPFVVCGTHGKTTTSALLAYLLDRAGLDPGMLIGGIPRDFDESFKLGRDRGPFVVEGDEYDSAFFEKTPKFWQYRPSAAILTSIEHDHIDIYPDEASYIDAFRGLIDRLPAHGLLAVWAGCPIARALAKDAPCRVVYYALSSDDCGDGTPEWSAAPLQSFGGAHPFALFAAGSSIGTVMSPLSGKHNVRNALAALILATERGGAPLANAIDALRAFRGVKRRQELLGIAAGVRVYDDFAHHPSAVRETLSGLRERHPDGRLIAAFEPRSATASRRLHQAAYESAFDDADLVVLAPVGRPEIADAERLDTKLLADALRQRGREAVAPAELGGVLETLAGAGPGDTVVLMSNGDFGGIHDRLLALLAAA